MKISIVGIGHLGSCLLRGLLKSGVGRNDITVYARRGEVCEKVASEYGVACTQDIETAVRSGDTVFIVIKSAGFEELFASVPSEAWEGKTAVSFMGGVGFERIKTALPNAKVVLAMPSIAIESCSGVTAYTECSEKVAEIFRSLGYAFCVTADEIGKVMAFASCGVGFAAYIMDAYVRAGVAMGFSGEDSKKIAAITFQNALDSGDFGKTVTAVATKGGATEQGVLSMENAGVPGILTDAMLAAYNKLKY